MMWNASPAINGLLSLLTNKKTINLLLNDQKKLLNFEAVVDCHLTV